MSGLDTEFQRQHNSRSSFTLQNKGEGVSRPPQVELELLPSLSHLQLFMLLVTTRRMESPPWALSPPSLRHWEEPAELRTLHWVRAGVRV